MHSLVTRLARTSTSKLSWNHIFCDRCSGVLSPHTASRRHIGADWFRYLTSKKEKSYAVVAPATVSPIKPVPSTIRVPGYVSHPHTYNYGDLDGQIEIKSEDQIEGMRAACQTAAQVLEETSQHIAPGCTTDQLDQVAHNACIKRECYPSPLAYKSFPKSICTSVNNVVVHGIPDSRELQLGDIISIDVTVYLNGFHGDLCATYGVGKIDSGADILLQVTQECRDLAISQCGPGVHFANIGNVIQEHAEEYGLEVVPYFCGHGIGSYFHGAPQVLHYGNDGPEIMLPGMTFTIEPILSEGDWEVKSWPDGWTYTTSDHSRTAQWEHTVLITEHGCEVLTELNS